MPIPLSLSAFLIALIMMGKWDGADSSQFIKMYEKKANFRKTVERTVSKSKNFSDLTALIKREKDQFEISPNKFL